jgi:hypothetical protein
MGTSNVFCSEILRLFKNRVVVILNFFVSPVNNSSRDTLIICISYFCLCPKPEKKSSSNPFELKNDENILFGSTPLPENLNPECS